MASRTPGKLNSIPLLLSGIRPQTAHDLEAFGLTALIGEQSIFPHIDAALAKAEELVGTTN